jgi:hypothetical protein
MYQTKYSIDTLLASRSLDFDGRSPFELRDRSLVLVEARVSVGSGSLRSRPVCGSSFSLVSPRLCKVFRTISLLSTSRLIASAKACNKRLVLSAS